MKPFNKTNSFSKKGAGKFEKKEFETKDFNRHADSGSRRGDSGRYGDSAPKRFGGDSSPKQFGARVAPRSKMKDSGFEVHEVICDGCGQKCDVPFKPTNNKPVYCRSCFRNKDSLEPQERSRSRFNDDFEPRVNPTPSVAELEKINRKLDKIMRALKID